MKNKLLKAATVAAVMSLAGGHAVASPAYAVIDLGAMGGDSFATSINNDGQVSGVSYLTSPKNTSYARAFIYTNGTMTDLGTLGGTASVGYGLNNLGQIVGVSSNRDNSGSSAFLYSSGTMEALGTPFTPGDAYGINDYGQIVGGMQFGNRFQAFLYDGGTIRNLGSLAGDSHAYDINNVGQVVGLSFTSLSNDTYHAFIYADGNMADIGTLGGIFSSASRINSLGQVVGYSGIGGDRYATHAFLFSSGTMTDLTTLGGSSSGASGINDSGQIVGWSTIVGDEMAHGFLFEGGRMLDVNDLIDPQIGWTVRAASDINASGQISASGCNLRGECHALLLTPIDSQASEPASLALFGIGLAGLLAARRRIKN